MFLNRLKIGVRLAVGFSVILVLATLAIGYSAISLQQLAASTRDMMDEPLSKERLINEWAKNINVNVRRTTALALTKDEKLEGLFAKDQADSAKRSAELQKSIEQLIAGESENERFYADIQARRQIYLAARDVVLKAKKAGDLESAGQAFDSQFAPSTQPYLDAVERFSQRQGTEIDALVKGVEASYQRSLAILLAGALLIIGLSLLLAWVLTRSISIPMGEAVQLAQRVAAGDLTVRIDTDPQSQSETEKLKLALQTMTGALTQLVSGIRASAQSISLGSGEIEQGNLDLSNRTESQAANVEETSASMAELNSTVQLNAENARQAGSLAQDSMQIAQEGGLAVSAVIESMSGIESSSKKIAQITGVIDGIAFQTNILALNAAVEAARAGESGRGFAVVASEVRSLAQRAAEAAREIRGLIAASVTEAERGGSLVHDAGNTMTRLVRSVEELHGLIGNIARSSDEQRLGVQEVNSAIQQIDSITQQNAALVEEASAAASSLRGQASHLENEVAIFKT